MNSYNPFQNIWNKGLVLYQMISPSFAYVVARVKACRIILITHVRKQMYWILNKNNLSIMNRFNILAKLLLITTVSVFLPAPTIEFSVGEVFSKFKFRKRSRLLQFWACTPCDTEDGGFNLMLTDQFVMSTPDKGLLQAYRNKCLKKCLENRYPAVGVETKVGNWLAGRAAQTWIADHRTKHHVLIQEDQHSADVGGKGQLALHVFNHQGVLVGIIEFVTPVAKQRYVEDFEQLKNLLEGLNQTNITNTE